MAPAHLHRIEAAQRADVVWRGGAAPSPPAESRADVEHRGTGGIEASFRTEAGGPGSMGASSGAEFPRGRGGLPLFRRKPSATLAVCPTPGRASEVCDRAGLSRSSRQTRLATRASYGIHGNLCSCQLNLIVDRSKRSFDAGRRVLARDPCLPHPRPPPALSNQLAECAFFSGAALVSGDILHLCEALSGGRAPRS